MTRILAALALVCACNAAEYLIIASGQSNMAGIVPCKDMPEAIRQVPANVVYYHAPAIDKPATTFADQAKYGPVPTIVLAIASARPKDRFVILHDAVGGSALCQWVPDYAPKELVAGKIKIGDLAAAMKPRLAAVRKAHPEAKPFAFLWLQGESDKGPLAGVYQENLARLLANMRADTGNPNLLAVIGEPALADEGVYDAIHALTKADKASVLVATRELSHNQLHFNAKGYEAVGKLFADAVLQRLAATKR